ncbi:probable NAD(P)H dehydrogenase subunit CRR3, chloroplastic [Chenopodium quinoa]|uniref:probable NAD(P)H dehydrogenase subunit CRR3, chloroplastic n=1 Tax=Chenopodium quinoa TaxID=63459 RepID=UPI000B770CFC|nr:probable NAD(P)H dehydrogenase subunit CRR3, chloroplastic [Chenopodium quinoa]
MILSGCISITKPGFTLASLSQSSSKHTTPRKPSKITPPKPSHSPQIQPSIAEIERAIGAGKYRDHDPASISDPAEKNSVFDAVLANSVGKTEGKTERALRETGEWINEQTERATRSSGKKILEVMFFWIAPAWFLLFFIATGAVKLPFTSPVLDDLLM